MDALDAFDRIVTEIAGEVQGPEPTPSADGARQTYWHGGAPGLRRILPPDTTGAPSNAQYGAQGVCRTDRVYITNTREAAQMFAACHTSGRGWIYEVTPVGELEDDPDFHYTGNDAVKSLQCAEAVVIRGKPVAHQVQQAIIASLMWPGQQARASQFVTRRNQWLGLRQVMGGAARDAGTRHRRTGEPHRGLPRSRPRAAGRGVA